LTSTESSRRQSREVRGTTEITLSVVRPRWDSSERGSGDVIRVDLVGEVESKCAIKHIPIEIQHVDQRRESGYRPSREMSISDEGNDNDPR
jgi:hypothetical protein